METVSVSYKTFKVIALPAKNESGCFSYTPKQTLHKKLLIGKPHHLYIISDEDTIRKKDKVIHKKSVLTVIENKGLYLSVEEFSHIDVRTDLCVKIVATTDTSIQALVLKLGLASIPESFIQNYIKSYNEGNAITEVDLDLEYIGNEFVDPLNKGYIIKTNPDNTVIIHKKGKWFFYWKKVQGRICNSDYRFIKEEDDYLYNDEDAHLMEVQSWAERIDNVGNYSERGYEYGFDDIECPPKEWIDKKIKSIEEDIKFGTERIEFLKSL